MFTKRHFITIAKIIRDVSNPTERARIASKFALLFNQENPKFNQMKFQEACGIEDFE